MNEHRIEPISVLIPTMNRPEALKRTLMTYMNGKVIPAQIIIVDQSQEAKVAKENLRAVEFYKDRTDILYIYQNVPSTTQARNNAVKQATNEIIIFSDDDVDVYQNTLSNIDEIMQDKQIAMIAGIDDNMPKTSSNIGYLLGTKSFRNRKIGHVTMSMLGRFPDKIIGQISTQWAMGYFFVVRKSLMDKWQLKWDEKLVSYAYAEDLDFSFSYYKKAKEEKLSCVLDEHVRVKHMVSKEYRIPSKKSTYMYVVNRAYLSYKHNMGCVGRVVMNWCNFWRWIERVVRKENPKDIRDAIRWVRKNKKEVQKGILNYLP